MMPHNRDDRIREVDPLEDLRADYCVDFHLVEFGGGEFARLVQDVVWNCNLADVVQQRAGFESLDFELAQPEMSRQPAGVHLNSIDVIVSNFVLRINRGGKRFHGGQMDTAYALDGTGSLIGLLEVKMTGRKENRNHRTCPEQRD